MTEPTFDSTQTTRCMLTVRLSIASFTYVIHNPEQPDQTFHYCIERPDPHISFMANIKEKVLPHKFLQQTYKQIRFLFAQPLCTTVPLEYFNESQAERYYYYCFSQELNRQVCSTPLPACGVAVLYAVDKAAYQLLKDSFPEAVYLSTNIPMLNYLQKKSLTVSQHQLHAYLHEQRMDLYVFRNGRFLFMNTFQNLQTEDVAYYILYTWKNLKLNQQTDTCYLISDLLKTDSIIANLQPYIQNLGILTPSSTFGQTVYAQKNIAFDLQTYLITDC